MSNTSIKAAAAFIQSDQTEMFSDGTIDLVERGVITGKYKAVHSGLLISSLAIDSQRLYDFMDTNLIMRFKNVECVNNPAHIRKKPGVTAINSAIEIDIFRQVCAESIGFRQHNGVGGQIDFMEGAAPSQEDKPIIAIPSVTSKGISRIVSRLQPGASVVTTRSHVHYVVTEYGIAHLMRKKLQQLAQALITLLTRITGNNYKKMCWT